MEGVTPPSLMSLLPHGLSLIQLGRPWTDLVHSPLVGSSMPVGIFGRWSRLGCSSLGRWPLIVVGFVPSAHVRPLAPISLMLLPHNPPLYGLGGGRSGGVGLVALVVLGDDVPRLVEVVLSQGW